MASLIIPRQRRVGLVIGNANYRAGGPLANPRRDAEATARRLHEFEFELVDGGPHFDLDQGRFRGTLESFGAQIRGSNVALFYYSGHGIQLDGRNYLIPVDVPPRDPTTIILRMINIADILHLVERSDNRLNILILDACRDNPFSALSGHRSVTEGLTELPPPSGTIICYSALPGHVALDGKEGGHSPFAEALLEAMTEKADSSVLDFFDIVAERVYRKTDGRQRPLCQSSILGDARGFRFRPRRAELEAAAWAQLPSPPTADALQAFLAAYPDGVHSEAAKNQLAALHAAAEQERLRLEHARSEAAAWAQLPNPPTVDALQAFLEAYPDGAHSEAANNELAALRLAAEQERLRLERARSEAAAWAQLPNPPTVDDLQVFLDTYPDGANSEAATQQLVILRESAEQERLRVERAQLEEAAWAQLPKPPTVDALQGFLATYPDGAHAEAANSQLAVLDSAAEEERLRRELAEMDAAAWAQVPNPPTVDALEVFLDAYPDGAHSEGARKQLAVLRLVAEQERQRRERAQSEAAAWRLVPQHRADALQAFLDAYRDGAHAEAAKEQLAALHAGEEQERLKLQRGQLEAVDWSHLPSTPTVDAIESFLDAFPDGAHAEGAKDQLAALHAAAEEERQNVERAQAEAAAWARLPNPPTIDALCAYLDAYPDGTYSEAANEQLAVLHAARMRLERGQSEAAARAQPSNPRPGAAAVSSCAPEHWLTMVLRAHSVRMVIGVICGLLSAFAYTLMPYPIGMGAGHTLLGVSLPNIPVIAPIAPSLSLAAGLVLILNAEHRITWKARALVLLASYLAWLSAFWLALYGVFYGSDDLILRPTMVLSFGLAGYIGSFLLSLALSAIVRGITSVGRLTLRTASRTSVALGLWGAIATIPVVTVPGIKSEHLLDPDLGFLLGLFVPWQGWYASIFMLVVAQEDKQ